MRIRGGGRVLVEVPRRERMRAVGVVEPDWRRDGFDVVPVRRVSKKLEVKLVSVVLDLGREGRRRIASDMVDRTGSSLREVGRFLGRLTGDVVVELINHYAQRPPAERAGPMLALGAFAGALFVEYWAARRGPDVVQRLLEDDADDALVLRELGMTAEQALEAFVDFIEVTEGQPARRLAGTLYALG